MTPTRMGMVQRVMASLVVAIAVVALCGWAFDVPALARMAPHGTTVKVNTAVSLAALALATMTGSSRRARRVTVLVAAAIAALAAAMIAEWVFGVDLGIDQLLFHDPFATSAPGRTAPNTAVALVLLSAALVLVEGDARRVGLVLCGVAGAIGWAGAVGVITGTATLSGIGSTTHIALPTSIAVVLLALAILAREVRTEPGSIIFSDGSGGTLVRRLLPIAFLVPTIVGALVVGGRRGGLYGGDIAIWLLIVSSIAALAVLSWRSARDVDRRETERRATQAALREANERLALVVDASPLAIITFDIDAVVTSWNPAAEELFGWSAEEAIGMLNPIVPKRDWHELTDTVRRAQKGMLTRADRERVRKDGTLVQVSLTGGPLRGVTGELIGVVAIIADISERKRQEAAIRQLNAELEHRVVLRTAELDRANRELEAFAYSVAHDLRAPLRAIEGFSAALREDYHERVDETGQEYIRRVCAATSRMGVLIDDLLDLSRIGRAELHVDEVDLGEHAREIIHDLREREPERHVEFVAPESAVARGDPQLLHIALENLVGNAWKFTGTRELAHIELGMHNGGADPTFFVHDDGVGFDMAYVSKLFAPFQRLHGSEFPGTGIGLATVQRIVSRHGGRVWAEGTPDGGATFSFTLGETG